MTRNDRQLWDAEAVAGDRVEPGSVFAFLARRRCELFDDSFISDLSSARTGRSLTQTSFDPSTLVYWRRRIASSSRPDRVFDKVAEVIAETGILRGRRKRCLDSTIFDDEVATQDTVTQLVAAVRKVARVVPGAAAVVTQVCRLDYSRPGKPDIDWDDPHAKRQLVWLTTRWRCWRG